MRKTLKLAILVNLQVTFSQSFEWFYQMSQNMATDLHILNWDYFEIKEKMSTSEFLGASH